LKKLENLKSKVPPVFMTYIFRCLHCLTLFVLIAFGSCKKDDTVSTPIFDAAKQAAIDDTLLMDYFKNNPSESGATKTSSGLYYRITKSLPASTVSDSLKLDSVTIKQGRTVFVRYQLYLLNETLLESNIENAEAFRFFPGSSSVISAWQEGIPLFKSGEEGYLYLPSRLGYKNVAQSKFPANTCLKFFIQITNVER